MFRILFPLIVIFLSYHSGLLAQVQAAVVPGMLSLTPRAQPLSTSGLFLITESGYSHPIVGGDPSLTWEFGLMVNRVGSSAIGGSFYAVQSLSDGCRWGFKARYRRWLNESVSVDLSPGILLKVGGRGAPGLTGQVALGFKDKVSILSQWELVRSCCTYERMESRHFRVEWSAGLKLGSRPALYSVALEAALVMLAIAVNAFETPDIAEFIF